MLKRGGRVLRHLGASSGQGLQRTSERGDFRRGVATRGAEHHICEVGVRLEVQGAWRRGAGEGEAGGKEVQAA